MARARPLTRDAIVEAAMAYADAHDLESLSARSLAARLEVTPMALYRHVRNKDEILDAVVDVLLARLGLPEQQGADWQSWLEEMARSLRQTLVEHPVAVGVFTRGPVTTPAARARLTAAVEFLCEAGFSQTAAVRAYAAVHTYTVGFSALEASRRAAARSSRSERPPADHSGALIAQFVSEEQFLHGLHALLVGLARS